MHQRDIFLRLAITLLVEIYGGWWYIVTQMAIALTDIRFLILTITPY
ncbi:hypothetical protein [Scytonema sp. HK-05]|nr:hypothetical protein [Scytonema sp. HK-05]